MSEARRPGSLAGSAFADAADPAEDILISVIVPAFDAAATLEETVASALGQTLSALEVIVVDDGSRDDTADIAARLARADRRLRLVRSDNRGVGHARNLGIQHARGRYVAPLDADDIWHPTKLEKQLDVFRARPDLGLVYCHCDRIDDKGRVIYRLPCYAADGWALLQHAFFNFISNGSAIMVPRAIALELGGYAPGLRAVGAEGCEDYLLQLRILARHRVACVPEALVGYRAHASNMSADGLRMSKSECIALRLVLTGLPDDVGAVRDEVYFKSDAVVLYNALGRRDWEVVAAAWRAIGARESALSGLARTSRLATDIVHARLARAPSAIKRRLGRAQVPPFFDARRPLTGGSLSPRLQRALAMLAAIDRECGSLIATESRDALALVDDPLLDLLVSRRAASVPQIETLFPTEPLASLSESPTP